MVSLENRAKYIDSIMGVPKVYCYYNFIKEKQIGYLPNQESFIDEQFIALVKAIQSNDKKGFEDIYNKKSKSKPSKDSPSPFINDDFMIFILIIGISKFGINKEWIKQIVSLRNKNTITLSFENIVEENFNSVNNIFEIVLVFHKQLDSGKISNELLDKAYQCIIDRTELFESKNDFLIVSSLVAYDLIIKYKSATSSKEYYELINFKERFFKRIKILTWAIQCGISMVVLYFILKLKVYLPETVQWIEDNNYVFTIIGALGFTILGNAIPVIRKKSFELILRSFGFPKNLIGK